MFAFTTPTSQAKTIIGLWVLSFLVNASVFGLEFKDLDEKQRKKLEDGAAVTVTFESGEFKNAPWPVVAVFKLINASPLDAVSIFGALDYQEKYVPKTKRSRPVKHISATEVHTEYEISVPFPLPNAVHIHGSQLKQTGVGFMLEWYRVSSNSTEEAKGFARFSPYQNRTLMEYQTFIIPKSIFGPLVKKIMISDVESTVLAIAKHTEELVKTQSPILTKYRDFTTRSLAGEKVYQPFIEQSKP